MNDDFSNYQRMRDSGISPDAVYREAMENGLDLIGRIRMIRAVFSLTPVEAKEIMIRVEGEGRSLDEHQEIIADHLSKSRTQAEIL